CPASRRRTIRSSATRRSARRKSFLNMETTSGSLGWNGGEARRLTAGIAREFNPHFSPDGTQVTWLWQRVAQINVEQVRMRLLRSGCRNDPRLFHYVRVLVYQRECSVISVLP